MWMLLVMLLLPVTMLAQYHLRIIPVDKDSAFIYGTLNCRTVSTTSLPVPSMCKLPVVAGWRIRRCVGRKTACAMIPFGGNGAVCVVNNCGGYNYT